MTPAGTLRTPAALAEAGLVAPASCAALDRVAERYAVAITPGVAELIDRNDPDDPIARQFVPDPAELVGAPGEIADPIGDEPHSPVEGVVHRYPDRVLLKPVTTCAVYCRYCFRREAVGPGKGHLLSTAALERALDYIRARPAIWEVILTGGDPLVLSPRRIGTLVRAIGAIPHVCVVRVHTRLPVVDPDRITDELVQALRAEGAATWLVIHANHARELSPPVRAALARIADAGVPILSQSVLLRGVNDDPSTLEALLRSLVACRVKPYYLHHCDHAPGTGHFRTTLAEGQALMRGLRGRLSGLCQPDYVLDIPGGHGKSPVGPRYLHPDPPDELSSPDPSHVIEDWRGALHPYPPEPAS